MKIRDYAENNAKLPFNGKVVHYFKLQKGKKIDEALKIHSRNVISIPKDRKDFI